MPPQRRVDASLERRGARRWSHDSDLHADVVLGSLAASLDCPGGGQPWLCTLRLEQQRLARREQPLQRGELTLATCRRRYQLPDYPAHNALWDALATAELLLAHHARA